MILRLVNAGQGNDLIFHQNSVSYLRNLSERYSNSSNGIWKRLTGQVTKFIHEFLLHVVVVVVAGVMF